jgi:hypothetical protein
VGRCGVVVGRCGSLWGRCGVVVGRCGSFHVLVTTEKTAGLRRGKFSDSNSACLKVLVPVKIFQFQDMLNESERYQDAANVLVRKSLTFLSRKW